MQEENFICGAIDETAQPRLSAARTDNQLVHEAISGDSLAYEEIFERHKRLVAIIASRYLRRSEEIEEIVQTSFAKAFTELDKFNGRYERSFTSWIAKITRNTCVDLIRNCNRKPETLNCELSDHEIETIQNFSATNSKTAEAALLERDLAEKLLLKLSPDERALLKMLYSDEMSTAEIAETLGCTRANVKIQAWRARAELRKILKKYL